MAPKNGTTPTPDATEASELKRLILAKDDATTEAVQIPEWGVTVYVRSLTGTERDAFESSLVRKVGRKTQVTTDNIRAKLVAKTVVDSKGNAVFTDEDVVALGKKNASALNRIYEVSARLSRITEEDVEELAGNSAAGPSAVSS